MPDFTWDLNELSPHQADDVLDRFHGFGGGSEIGIFTFAAWMFDVEDHNLVGGIVHGVINQIKIFFRHHPSDARNVLMAADMREQDQILYGLVDGGSHSFCSRRIANAKIIGNGGYVFDRPGCEAYLHRSKRRNAASTS